MGIDGRARGAGTVVEPGAEGVNLEQVLVKGIGVVCRGDQRVDRPELQHGLAVHSGALVIADSPALIPGRPIVAIGIGVVVG